jgi:hypothetical protein
MQFAMAGPPKTATASHSTRPKRGRRYPTDCVSKNGPMTDPGVLAGCCGKALTLSQCPKKVSELGRQLQIFGFSVPRDTAY